LGRDLAIAGDPTPFCSRKLWNPLQFRDFFAIARKTYPIPALRTP
jgi:hypothetical protein